MPTLVLRQNCGWIRFPDEEDQRLKAAEALERVVRNYLELVVIDLGEKDDPHVIFETLNARGTPATSVGHDQEQNPLHGGNSQHK